MRQLGTRIQAPTLQNSIHNGCHSLNTTPICRKYQNHVLRSYGEHSPSITSSYHHQILHAVQMDASSRICKCVRIYVQHGQTIFEQFKSSMSSSITDSYPLSFSYTISHCPSKVVFPINFQRIPIYSHISRLHSPTHSGPPISTPSSISNIPNHTPHLPSIPPSTHLLKPSSPKNSSPHSPPP